MQVMNSREKIAGRTGEMILPYGARGNIWRVLTRADKMLIAVALLGAIILETGRRFEGAPGGEVVIEVDGTRVATLSLDQPQEVQIKGIAGSSKVEIGVRGARIIQAPCPHGICVRRGWVYRRGEVVVCVPNRLVLTIVGGDEPNDIDAVIR